MEATLAAIAKMFPEEGTLFLTHAGRRVEAPALYRWARGWKTNVAGCWHLFDAEGRFVSAGEDNRWRVGPLAAGLPPLPEEG